MKNNYIPIIVPQHLEHIETILRELYALNYIGILDDNSRYVLLDKGLEELSKMSKMYMEVKRYYKTFQRVNLNKSEFATEYFWEMNSDEEWNAFYDNLDRNHWLNFQLNIAEYKKINIPELIFVALLHENEFTSGNTWAFDVYSGIIFNTKINDTYINNYTTSDMYKLTPGVSYDNFIKNILEAGNQVFLNFIRESVKRDKEDNYVETIKTNDGYILYEESEIDYELYTDIEYVPSHWTRW